jgi:hypothetical protein
VFDKTEEDVREATTKYEAFLKRSRDIESIYEEEGPLKTTPIALLRSKIEVYDSTERKDHVSDRQTYFQCIGIGKSSEFIKLTVQSWNMTVWRSS